ncbi:hypothetical protein FOA52_010010 [Chlamydomonas sp. UWO 241]|nr:hypothetical protein FOA52_010010 [Chlamydomonas sp. UWO 241]
MAFGLLQNLYKHLQSKWEKKLTLVCLGLDNAGKTTTINTLNGLLEEEATPTFGFQAQHLTEGRFKMDELTRQLHVERAMRRACEKWLRAELKSRDDYDLLLRTIRDTACASAQGLSPAALQAARSSLRSGGGGGGSGVRSAASTGGGASPQGSNTAARDDEPNR